MARAHRVDRRDRSEAAVTLRERVDGEYSECGYVDCRVPSKRHSSCAAKDISNCWPPAFDVSGWRLHHQHVPKRSQGGKECHVMLCAGHHDNIDNGTRYEGLRVSNRFIHGASRDYYVIEDRDTGEVRVKLEVKE